ncbi:MAG: hypothetical protein AAF773_08725 [Cyanobacteria bacterium P01_D01_bin.115]
MADFNVTLRRHCLYPGRSLETLTLTQLGEPKSRKADRHRVAYADINAFESLPMSFEPDSPLASDSADRADSATSTAVSLLRNFLIGAAISGLVVFVYASLSVDMTYGSWAALNRSQQVGAVALPLVCGLLSAILGQRMTKGLISLLESVNLPF